MRVGSVAHTTAIIVLCTCSQAFLTAVSVSVPTLAPIIAEDLGLPATLVGAHTSLLYLAAMPSSLMAGTLIEQKGGARAIQIACVLALLSLASMAMGSIISIAAGALLLGAAYGITNPTTAHLLLHFTPPQHRNAVFSVKQSGVPAGGIIAGFLLPATAIAHGWRTALGLLAVAILLLALAFQFMRPGTDAGRNAQLPLWGLPVAGLAAAWKNSSIRNLSLMAALFAMVQFSITTFLVTFLVQEVGFTLVQAGIAFSLCNVAGIAGRLLLGWLSDRFGSGRMLVLSGVCMMIGAGTVVAISPEWQRALVQLVLASFAIFAMGWSGVYLAEIAGRSPRDQVGSITGASLFLNFMGIMVGPSLMAAVSASYGTYKAGFAIMVVAAIGGAVAAAAGTRTTTTAPAQ